MSVREVPVLPEAPLDPMDPAHDARPWVPKRERCRETVRMTPAPDAADLATWDTLAGETLFGEERE